MKFIFLANKVTFVSNETQKKKFFFILKNSDYFSF